MTVCSHCGYLDHEDRPHCPECGHGRDAAGPGAVEPGGWEKAVIGAEQPKQERPRFGESDDFYQPLQRPSPAPLSPAAPAATPPLAAAPPPADEGATIIQRRPTMPLAYLVERTGGTAGKVHRLAEQNGIGRSRRTEENSIVLGEDTVSRRHGRVSFERGRFYYTDLESSNGSFIVEAQGHRTPIAKFEPHPLEDAQTIELGDIQLTYIEIE